MDHGEQHQLELVDDLLQGGHLELVLLLLYRLVVQRDNEIQACWYSVMTCSKEVTVRWSLGWLQSIGKESTEHRQGILLQVSLS